MLGPNDIKMVPDRSMNDVLHKKTVALVSIWQIQDPDKEYSCTKQYYVNDPVFLDSSASEDFTPYDENEIRRLK